MVKGFPSQEGRALTFWGLCQPESLRGFCTGHLLFVILGRRGIYFSSPQNPKIYLLKIQRSVERCLCSSVCWSDEMKGVKQTKMPRENHSVNKPPKTNPLKN
jgi:hypothetical protein